MCVQAFEHIRDKVHEIRGQMAGAGAHFPVWGPGGIGSSDSVTGTFPHGAILSSLGCEVGADNIH